MEADEATIALLADQAMQVSKVYSRFQPFSSIVDQVKAEVTRLAVMLVEMKNANDLPGQWPIAAQRLSWSKQSSLVENSSILHGIASFIGSRPELQGTQIKGGNYQMYCDSVFAALYDMVAMETTSLKEARNKLRNMARQARRASQHGSTINPTQQGVERHSGKNRVYRQRHRAH